MPWAGVWRPRQGCGAFHAAAHTSLRGIACTNPMCGPFPLVPTLRERARRGDTQEHTRNNESPDPLAHSKQLMKNYHLLSLPVDISNLHAKLTSGKRHSWWTK